MDRTTRLAMLTEQKPMLAERFGVQKLALFDSFARDTAREDSDVDVLVDFDGPATAERYFGVQFYLEDLLGREIELAIENALRPRLRRYVERDVVKVRPRRSALRTRCGTCSSWRFRACAACWSSCLRRYPAAHRTKSHYPCSCF